MQKKRIPRVQHLSRWFEQNINVIIWIRYFLTHIIPLMNYLSLICIHSKFWLLQIVYFLLKNCGIIPNIWVSQAAQPLSVFDINSNSFRSFFIKFSKASQAEEASSITNPQLLRTWRWQWCITFQLLEYQMWWAGGWIWYSREIELLPPCTEDPPL